MDKKDQLIDAVKAGNKDQVQALLVADPSLASITTPEGLQVVLLAAYYNQPGIASLLAAQRSDLTIFEAASVGAVDRVEALLDEDPSLANAVAADGFQPLGLACFFGKEETAALLIRRGAEVNAPAHNPQKVMPLHSAVASQQLGIARLLLENGADPNAIQEDSFTPLHAAAQNNQMAMVDLLVRHGARLSPRADDHHTPLALARAMGHTTIAHWLESHGAEM